MQQDIPYEKMLRFFSKEKMFRDCVFLSEFGPIGDFRDSLKKQDLLFRLVQTPRNFQSLQNVWILRAYYLLKK